MNITIYTKPNCTHCTQAKALLESHNLPYTFINLSETQSGENFISRDELLQLFPNARTMPQIVIDGETIGGFTELKTFLQKQFI